MTAEPICNYLRRHHTGMVVAGMRDGSEAIAMPGDTFDMGGGVMVELIDTTPNYPSWGVLIGVLALGCAVVWWAV